MSNIDRYLSGDYIKKNHSYQVPEIACIDITDVSTEYGNWIINDLSMRKDK